MLYIDKVENDAKMLDNFEFITALKSSCIRRLLQGRVVFVV